MGNRVSISFAKGGEESVTLFSHWGGFEFADMALDYAKRLKNERQGHMRPLDRLEPHTVMVDFIRDITKDMTRVESDLYLGKDSTEGDNSDNGHFTVNLESLKLEK